MHAKRALLTMLLIMARVSPETVAHSGRLNSEGCHNQKATGGYHCHAPHSKTSTLANVNSAPGKYVRSDYGYRSYNSRSNVGYYTGKPCATNIDHVVSLNDAHNSGAWLWSSEDKANFANDRVNHVSSCVKVNSSKGSSTPSDFLRKASDGNGLDYELMELCEYLKIYHSVKRKYKLSFSNNSSTLFSSCSLDISK